MKKRLIMMRSRDVAVVLFVLLAACSSNGNKSPTSPTESGSPTVVVGFVPAGGTYTATLNNQTYTTTGGFVVTLSPGTYEISGSFAAAGFGIGFGNVLGGGAESGSIRSLSGPGSSVTSCGVTYTSSGSGAQQFRMSFRVTTTVGSACQ